MEKKESLHYDKSIYKYHTEKLKLKKKGYKNEEM